MVSSKVTERTFMIDTMGLGHPNTIAVYVVKGEKKVAVVDCGYASSHESVLQGLQELGIAASEVDFLIPTHVHLDHAGGAGHLIDKMTRAKVVAHERAVPYLVNPTRLVESATSVFGPSLVRQYGYPKPLDKERIVAVGEESRLELGGVSLTIMHAPGHAPHQVAIAVEEDHLILSADAVGIVFPSVPTLIPTTPPPSFDPVKLAQTIDKLSQTDPKMALVPHYGVRKDVNHVLEATKEKTNAWVEEVRKMSDRRMTPDHIAEALARGIIEEVGMRPQDFPPYAMVMVRISAMGILHFLERDDSAAAGRQTASTAKT